MIADVAAEHLAGADLVAGWNENEVEPILQVLVGKSIEHARIEVIEENENNIISKHKSEYQQVREAELMETQRLEEMRGRKNDEIDRRNMQVRTAKN